MGNPTDRPRVLIVEDSPSYQELYEEILSPRYDLEIVGDKDKAIALVKQIVFDIALVDMRLKEVAGNVDGLDVVDCLRNLSPSTEIILKSGFLIQTPEIERRLKNMNLFAMLDKSTDGQVGRLREVVAQAIAKKRGTTSIEI